MADIRNDQYLHRPNAGRGAITPADPLESRLYDDNGNPVNPATEETLNEILDAVGAPDDSAQTDPAQSASQIALLKGLLSAIQSIKGTDGIKKIVDAVTVSGLSDLAKETTLGDVKTAVAALAALISDGRLKTEATLTGSLPQPTQPIPMSVQGFLPPFAEPPAMVIAGETLEEQLTQDDASNGELTFSEPIEYVEIYNVDESNDGVFTVNGISITVPAGQVYKSKVGGVPSAVVAVSGSTTEYIVGRYS